jgi:hypothetical protein
MQPFICVNRDKISKKEGKIPKKKKLITIEKEVSMYDVRFILK